MKKLIILVCLCTSCGVTEEDALLCSDWQASVGNEVINGNHAWWVGQALQLERIVHSDEEVEEAKGLAWTVTFLNGVEDGQAVQLVGFDEDHTYANVSESSVVFMGRRTGSGALVGRVEGLVNQTVQGDVRAQKVTITINSLPKGLDDFDARCLEGK